MKVRQPTRCMPYRSPWVLRYSSVKSISPPSGADGRPRKVKLRQYDSPALHGGETKIIMCPAGSMGTLSLRAGRPAALVILNWPTGFGLNSGRGEGVLSGGRPILARALFSFT